MRGGWGGCRIDFRGRLTVSRLQLKRVSRCRPAADAAGVHKRVNRKLRLRLAAWFSSAVAIPLAVPAEAMAAEGCGTSRVGEVTVATLRNAPLVTVSANGHPITLLLDTGAERTIV